MKRRITCEFFHENHAYKGFVLDLDDSGLFVRTNAVIKTGETIDIHLAASASGPAMSLLAEVSRRRAVPASLSTLIHPGLGVRILEAPREYGLLTGDGVLDEPIRREPESGTVEDCRADAKTTTERRRTAPNPEERDEERQSVPPRQPKPAPSEGVVREAVNDRRIPAGRGAAASDRYRVGGKLGGAASSDQPIRTSAVLVGGDDLDTAAALLEELGIETVRCGPHDPQLAALRDARLLVVSASVVISGAIPVDDGVIGIAVCEDVSETIRSLMRQKGFRYLVRRPVHPDALRLLFRYALFQRPDRRHHARRPIGCPVRWRVGWQRDSGALLEISASGCTLLASRELPLDTRIVIRIPREVAGAEALKVRGSVIRCAEEATREQPDRTVVAVGFDEASPGVRDRLREICERWSEGPPKLAEHVAAEIPHADREPPVDARPTANPRGETRPDESETSAPTADRRAMRRAVFDREIVELDAEGRAVQGLLARDLSPGGMRVDPQFGLDPGTKLRLALFDPSQREPLIVSAEVVRDDGDAGLGLHFVDLSNDTKTRIDAMIANLPAVESLGIDGQADGVLAGMVSDED